WKRRRTREEPRLPVPAARASQILRSSAHAGRHAVAGRTVSLAPVFVGVDSLLVVDPWHWLDANGALPANNARLRRRLLEVLRVVEYGSRSRGAGVVPRDRMQAAAERTPLHRPLDGRARSRRRLA